ncbi:ADP-ribosylglycohydrolase family protein [Brachybacterium tyrofermentans]|uniref:ADP-ribosylglycohydrolase family protein n=1 Tax=Brachybacterium tyrofermentans TaxID=47848 RepID=A0ABW0FLM2_9MICO|nr:ADP-ribosylglycohydrolase family protein [Brachybacterium tyrofermentans]
MNRLDIVSTVAVADALGAPYELGLHPGPGLSSSSFTIDTPEGAVRPTVRILGGEAPYGTWTDDTQIVLMVLDALRRAPSHPVAAYRENLIDWERGAFTPAGERLDVGIQTSSAIADLKRGVDPAPTTSSGNACLMVAIGVFARGNGAEHLEALVRTTHHSDKAVHDAQQLLEILDDARDGIEPVPTVDVSLLPTMEPTGFSESTLYLAQYALQTTESFLEGMDSITTAGGDTDSIGAVYGALCAVSGREAPQELRESLVAAELLERFAG